MTDFGFVRSDKFGQMVWPFRHMEDGDFFKVEPWERSLPLVRAMAYNRGNQLGRPREYVTARDEHGNAVVTRKADRGKLPRRPKVLDYEVARQAVAAYPGSWLDNLPVHYLEQGQTYRHNAARTQPLGEFPWFVVQLPDRRIGIVQDAEGFTVERVADDETFETYAARKMLLD